MGNRLFVGNLSFQTTKEALTEAFAAFGQVADVHIATDRETGRPRGFGFITMSSSEEAKQAMENMNGKNFDGRPLRVNEAEERAPRGGGGGGGGGGRGGFGGGGGGRGGRSGGNRW